MANRAVIVHHLLKAPALVHRVPQRSCFQKSRFSDQNALLCFPRCSSSKAHSSLEPPDVLHLAQTARISLTPQQAEEYAPKIRQVIDWFGQLQDVDLQTIEPAIRADTDVDNIREDVPEIFENRKAMISAVPSYEEPYIKVPKVLNKE